ncbi:uncharacterized protein LOC144103978 isoform X2 [Amblyomma americanum]
MFVRIAVLLLLAACAMASVWRTNYVIDQLLPSIGEKEIPLGRISFDVDTEGAKSGFIEFHLKNGALGDLHRRVRRERDCSFSDFTWSSQRKYIITCNLSLRGLVAKYDVEVIVDRKSERAAVEVLVDSGRLFTNMYSYLDKCTKCTELQFFSVELSSKMLPIETPLDFPRDVIKQFEREVVSRAKIGIAFAFNTTYKQAFEAKTAPLTVADFSA